MIEVSIIIVNYNSTALLFDCIQSIKKQSTLIKHEIIVVDNCSTDSGQLLLEQNKDIDVLVLNTINSGFGSANNIGVKKSQGKYVLLLNPDTIVLNDICGLFVSSFLGLNKKIGVLGCFQKNRDLSENHSFGCFTEHTLMSFLKSEFHQNCSKQLSSFVRKKKTYVLDIEQQEKQKQLNFKEVDWVNGACLFMDASVYKLIGGFDEKFFLFSEEVDLQRRLHKAGYHQYLINSPGLIHLHENKRKMNNTTRIFFYQGFLTYAKKNNSPCLFYSAKVVIFAIFLIGSFIDLITKRYSFSENCKLINTLFFR